MNSSRARQTDVAGCRQRPIVCHRRRDLGVVGRCRQRALVEHADQPSVPLDEQDRDPLERRDLPRRRHRQMLGYRRHCSCPEIADGGCPLSVCAPCPIPMPALGSEVPVGQHAFDHDVHLGAGPMPRRPRRAARRGQEPGEAGRRGQRQQREPPRRLVACASACAGSAGRCRARASRAGATSTRRRSARSPRASYGSARTGCAADGARERHADPHRRRLADHVHERRGRRPWIAARSALANASTSG